MKHPKCLQWMENAQLANAYSGYVPDDPEERAFLVGMIPEGE